MNIIMGACVLALYAIASVCVFKVAQLEWRAKRARRKPTPAELGLSSSCGSQDRAR